MYLDYFGLRQKPFLITPDPDFLYPSASHQRALGHLQYGLQREGGFTLLSGEVGTGKTTLCRRFLEVLPEHFRLAYILNARLDSAGLLAGICRELQIEFHSADDGRTLVEKIYDNLLAAHTQNRKTLVVIEEAQNLTPEVLETLRLLTNLETATSKLLHILLIGQPELLQILKLPGLRQLNQRVVSRSHLGPLHKDELQPYIAHRLKKAGTDQALFSAAAITRIYRLTGGIPRLINLLAEHCLVATYAMGNDRVTGKIVGAAARDLRAGDHHAGGLYRFGWKWRAPVLGALGALVLVAAVYLGQATTLRTTTVPAAAEITSDATRSTDSPVPHDPPQHDSLQHDPSQHDPSQQVSQQSFVAVTGVASGTGNGDNAYTKMLEVWGLQESIASLRQLCAVSSNNGLACLPVSISSPQDLLALNRPMIVRLREEAETLRYYLLSSIQDNRVALYGSGGATLRTVEDLLRLMDGEATLLWDPPSGYQGPLRQGERNPQLVAEITRLLHSSGVIGEGLVTGGVYNSYLAQQVREFQSQSGLAVDGILGFKTLLKLMEQQPGQPLLSVRGV